MTYVSPDDNWTQKLSIDISSFWGKYIGSLYFSMTTMLTVGYGDLSPVTEFEFLVIVVIQILGVVIFAYVVNEIGSTLSEIRKSDLILENNISMIEHLSNYYGLGHDLTLKARDYIAANQQVYAEINSED